jgi:hypothetical protein
MYAALAGRRGEHGLGTLGRRMQSGRIRGDFPKEALKQQVPTVGGAIANIRGCPDLLTLPLAPY